ncbi:ricin B-like lectin [Gymnopilus junonius]|uniref:Ricin B-like lectin n=1 Tax=Gymnopilus junonius TaxID=109634 RepID=A0A9P5NDT7_GYMJU|nr:ricin B-like lectin [Gymnopilus junonius]
MTSNVNSGSTYLITNVKAGTAMDLSAGDNTTVLGWPVNGDGGSANQHWAMNWTGQRWTFQNIYTGKFLTAVGTADGSNITASDVPFGWDIWPDENDSNTFRIFVPATHENLDLWGHGLATPGNPITLWWTWNGLHQTWNFTKV